MPCLLTESRINYINAVADMQSNQIELNQLNFVIKLLSAGGPNPLASRVVQEQRMVPKWGDKTETLDGGRLFPVRAMPRSVVQSGNHIMMVTCPQRGRTRRRA